MAGRTKDDDDDDDDGCGCDRTTRDGRSSRNSASSAANAAASSTGATLSLTVPLSGKSADTDKAEAGAEGRADRIAASLPAVALSAEAIEGDSDEVDAKASVWLETSAEAVSLAAAPDTAAAAAATGNRAPC